MLRELELLRAAMIHSADSFFLPKNVWKKRVQLGPLSLSSTLRKDVPAVGAKIPLQNEAAASNEVDRS